MPDKVETLAAPSTYNAPTTAQTLTGISQAELDTGVDTLFREVAMVDIGASPTTSTGSGSAMAYASPEGGSGAAPAISMPATYAPSTGTIGTGTTYYANSAPKQQGFIRRTYNWVKSLFGFSSKKQGCPDFIVSPDGTVYPVPKGAKGPKPVINAQGQQTGIAFTGGKGGANKQVDTIRIMNPTPARGKSPGYPNGYIKYNNSNRQGVNPYTGQTIPNTKSHYPIP